MRTLPQRITLGHDRTIRIEMPAPAGLPEGELEIIVDVHPISKTFEIKPKNKLVEICGKGKGKFWMSDDFDEPLEEFADYI